MKTVFSVTLFDILHVVLSIFHYGHEVKLCRAARLWLFTAET